jgi:hypothetical protein
LSVPKRCSDVGGDNVFSRSCACGEYGASCGAKAATSTSPATMAKPVVAIQFDRMTRQLFVRNLTTRDSRARPNTDTVDDSVD